MAYIFKLPDVGEGMAEGEIASWLVKVGDVVNEGDSILELQNDKLLQEIPSPVSGTVTKIMVEPGTVSKVGDPLVEFDGDGTGGEADVPAAATPEPATTQEAAAPAPQVEAKQEQPAPVAQPAVNNTPEPAVAGTQTGVVATDNPIGKVLAMPSVRRLAQLNHIAIETVLATGKHGHVTREDVENAINGGATATVATDQAATTEAIAMPTTAVQNAQLSETRESMSPMRKAISKAMVNSKATAPHVTLFDDVEVTKLVEHRNRFKAIAAEEDIKLTFLPYIVKALVSVIKKYPILNASLDNETLEIVYKNYYNIGIATDTERGLMVPTIQNADRQSMLDIASEITRLSTAAHDGSITAPDMSNGTISITNIGSVGGGWFTPVINYPEAAILGVGRINKEPIVNEDGELAVGQMLKLSLSFDHRLIDGATAQRAMNDLKKLLSDPEYLLMS